MANKKTEEKPKETKPPVFTRSELIDAADYFETTREVMAGALYGVKKATKEQAKKKLEEFIKKGVK